tara:strand:- start:2590 stop:3501 length:912 start_codon:yes stop_codon:yes gene_type:complete
MTSVCKNKYHLNDFQNIAEKHINELNDDIISIINELASKVGAPGYNKTPIFDKRKNKNKKYDNWSNIRNFKNTVLEKNTEGIEAQIDDIRIRLNKLTSNNYDNLSVEIIDYIKKEVETNNDILNYVGESIFDIGSMNCFWSKIYAKLFNDLIISFPLMKEICLTNFKKFLKLFDDIQFIDINNNNYDEFCENNKKNEKRRSMSSFFINLMHFDIISVDLMYTLINDLIDKIDYNDTSDDININEEIIENLFILIKNGYETLKEEDEEKWDTLIEQIENYANNKHEHISKKAVFKFLDLLDEIE